MAPHRRVERQRGDLDLPERLGARLGVCALGAGELLGGGLRTATAQLPTPRIITPSMHSLPADGRVALRAQLAIALAQQLPVPRAHPATRRRTSGYCADRA